VSEIRLEITKPRSLMRGAAIVGVVRIDAQCLRFRCPPDAAEVVVPSSAVEKFKIVEHGSLWLFAEVDAEARRRNSSSDATYDLVAICEDGAEQLLPLGLGYDDAVAWIERLTQALSQAIGQSTGPYR
jgi:hypothetical protein